MARLLSSGVRPALVSKLAAAALLVTIADVLILPVLGGLLFLGLFAAANPIIADALASIETGRLDLVRVIFWGMVFVVVWAVLRPRSLRRRQPRVGAALDVGAHARLRPVDAPFGQPRPNHQGNFKPKSLRTCFDPISAANKMATNQIRSTISTDTGLATGPEIAFTTQSMYG